MNTRHHPRFLAALMLCLLSAGIIVCQVALGEDDDDDVDSGKIEAVRFPDGFQPPQIAQRFNARTRPHAHWDRRGVPDWDPPAHMPKDVFTFVRIRYDSDGYRWNKWRTDYPDSDLNFSYRLQELTSLEVDPDGRVLELTDPELFNYPFIYIIEPGDIYLTPAETENLRKYCLNGGFLMVDDFWGDREWYNFKQVITEVFPNRKMKKLDLSHEIFKTVFVLNELPQVPALENALWGRSQGITWEAHKPGSEKPEFWAYHDDKGRMMCIICFNTDLGDGWEREGENHWYFKEFSEKKAYPMGINIVFYALTH